MMHVYRAYETPQSFVQGFRSRKRHGACEVCSMELRSQQSKILEAITVVLLEVFSCRDGL